MGTEIGMSGYNTELTHQGSSYHVQTQNMGSRGNYIETVIYKDGRVLTTRKTFYTEHLHSARLKEIIDRLAENQHNRILKEVEDGRFGHL